MHIATIVQIDMTKRVDTIADIVVRCFPVQRFELERTALLGIHRGNKMNEKCIKEIAEEAHWYSSEYKCDLYTALKDCIWGLTTHEEYIVAARLGIAEQFSTSESREQTT